MQVTAWRNLEVTPCIKLESMNFKKANKLPKVKNFYLELACRPWSNAIAYSFGANCQAMMISQWVHACMDIDFPLVTAEAKQQFAEWNAMYFLPISSFPHFLFLISHFLVPTFRVTPHKLSVRMQPEFNAFSLVPRPSWKKGQVFLLHGAGSNGVKNVFIAFPHALRCMHTG